MWLEKGPFRHFSRINIVVPVSEAQPSTAQVQELSQELDMDYRGDQDHPRPLPLPFLFLFHLIPLAHCHVLTE